MDWLRGGEVQDPIDRLPPSFCFSYTSCTTILPVCGVIFIVGLPSSEMRKGYGLAHLGIAVALPQIQRMVYVT